MPFELNTKIKNLTPYEPITGDYRIRLDANESFVRPNPEMAQKILQAVEAVDLRRYPDSCARELCRSFAAVYGVDPELVTAGNGSDELISLITNAFLQKGDALLTLEPDFSMYAFYGSLAEAESVILEKRPDFSVDVDAIISTAREKQARLILFSNPCNPTSLGIPAAEVQRLAENTDALVVVDEAYMDFYNQSVLDLVPRYDNLIVLRTCSKAAGMASLRLGFAVANAVLTKVLRAVKSPYNVNAVSQAIGRAVLSDPAYVRAGIAKIIVSRDALLESLWGIEGNYPQEFQVLGGNCNFMFCKAARAEEIFEYLKQQSIIIRNFGGFLRITAGTEAENAALIEKLEAFLGKATSQEPL